MKVIEIRPDDPRILNPTYSLGISGLSDSDDSDSDDTFYTPPSDIPGEICEHSGDELTNMIDLATKEEYVLRVI